MWCVRLSLAVLTGPCSSTRLSDFKVLGLGLGPRDDRKTQEVFSVGEGHRVLPDNSQVAGPPL